MLLNSILVPGMSVEAFDNMTLTSLHTELLEKMTAIYNYNSVSTVYLTKEYGDSKILVCLVKRANAKLAVLL